MIGERARSDDLRARLDTMQHQLNEARAALQTAEAADVLGVLVAAGELDRSMQRLSLTALLVRDYDEAIAFYRGNLGFEVIEDTQLSAGKRWVIVAPRGGGGALLLARADTDQQRAAVGEQSGGRVFLFLETDDFARDHADYSAKGVTFLAEPRHEPYGTVAVFKDLYGNRWDLMQPVLTGSRKTGPEDD